MNNNYIITFKNSEDGFTIYHSDTKKVTIEPSIPHTKYPRRYNLIKGYDADENGLKAYASDFEKFCLQMKTRNYFSIDYQQYFSDYIAVEATFKRLATKTNYKSHGQVTLEEFQWMNKCHNGGLTYCKPGTYKECFGYDFKMCYPNILGHSRDNFQFPSQPGYEVILKKVPKNLKFGYYRCLIQTDNEDFKKIFSFSKKNVYTNYSILFALELSEQFNVKVEMICDGEANAYVYKPEDIIKSVDVFGNWFNKLQQMKTDFPKNKLVKHLTSSVSGHLMRANCQTINFKDIGKDIEEDDLCFFTDNIPADAKYAIMEMNEDFDHPEKSYYKLLDVQQPMKYSIGRFKAFLLSFGRVKCARFALRDLKHLVRIQTDGLVFTKEQKEDIEQGVFIEDKTTGSITFKNVNSYSKD